jgi:WD40 repeat protein
VGHEDSINDLAFTPDSRNLVTASADSTARVWKLLTDNPTESSTVLRGHEADIYSLTITRDGHRLITASADGTARVWDLTISEPSASSIVLGGREGEVSLLAAAPDGSKLVTAGRGTTARLWDLNAQTPTTSAILLSEIETTLDWIRISPDGRWLVAGGRTADASLTDLKSTDLAKSYGILASHNGAVRKVAFSSDSHWLVTTTGYTLEELADKIELEHVARLYDLTALNPATSPKELNGHRGVIFDADFSPDGTLLATGSADRSVQIRRLNADDPSEPELVLKGHEDTIYRVLFGPHNQLVAASLDGDVRFWISPVSSSASPLRLTTTKPSGFLVSQSGHWLFSNDRLWDLTAEDPADSVSVFPGLSVCPPHRVSFSADGRWLVTSFEFPSEEVLFAWDRGRREPIIVPVDLTGGGGAHIENWGITADGKWLAVQTHLGDQSPTSEMRLWNLSTFDKDASPEFVLAKPQQSYSFDFSEDGQWLAAVLDGETINLYNLKTDNVDKNRITLHSSEFVSNVKFAPGNRWLITGNWKAEDKGKSLKLWDLTSRTAGMTHYPLLDDDLIGSVAFSPDKRLVTGDWEDSRQASIRLWDMTARNPGTSHTVLNHGQKIDSLKFDANGRWLATAAFGGTVQLWDLSQATSISRASKTFPATAKGVGLSLNYSPDGHWLVMSGYNQATQLWDLTKKNPQASTLQGHSYPLVKTAFSPDGHWLVTADTDIQPPSSPEQTCRIWDLTAPKPEDSAALLPTQECAADTIVITPDGRWLVTAGNRAGVRLWPLSTRLLLDIAQRTAGRGLTREEREEYFTAQQQ